ncbi:hypothetical protein CASFOL_019085 [Castilleja foliolosa]|uniref:Uncharacterized protein n=1 Tax=Castilleja foliolosa TaxID=1961234 RepID=A0ABD3D3D6_9LAMI
MEPTLEAINGGGGSVKVGTTGTISVLMSKELESTKPDLSRPKPKTSANEPSSSSLSTSGFTKTPKEPEIHKRTKTQARKSHQIPMLSDDNISIDGTPIRPKKPVRKGPAAGVVDIVDIKCGGSNRKWVNPITDRLKKISFSKLSESII